MCFIKTETCLYTVYRVQVVLEVQPWQMKANQFTTSLIKTQPNLPLLFCVNDWSIMKMINACTFAAQCVSAEMGWSWLFANEKGGELQLHELPVTLQRGRPRRRTCCLLSLYFTWIHHCNFQDQAWQHLRFYHSRCVARKHGCFCSFVPHSYVTMKPTQISTATHAENETAVCFWILNSYRKITDIDHLSICVPVVCMCVPVYLRGRAFTRWVHTINYLVSSCRSQHRCLIFRFRWHHSLMQHVSGAFIPKLIGSV